MLTHTLSNTNLTSTLSPITVTINHNDTFSHEKVKNKYNLLVYKVPYQPTGFNPLHQAATSLPFQLSASAGKSKSDDNEYVGLQASPHDRYALRSDILIQESIRQKLVNLIKPLQNNPHNYRNPKFINTKTKTPKDSNGIPYQRGVQKGKLQELIPQFAHFDAYK